MRVELIKEGLDEVESFRLSEEEAEILEQLAQDHNMSVSEYVRQLVRTIIEDEDLRFRIDL